MVINTFKDGKRFWGINNDENMTIDAIIGNPPYQNIQATEKAKINSAFASAVYPQFIELARKLKPNYVSMITPSRWMTKTGQGISEEWVDDMIKGNHFIAIYDYYDALDCFNGVEIKGGVNYFLFSWKYNGKCQYRLRQNGVTSENVEFLDALGAGIIIRDAVAPHIIDKVKRIEGDYFCQNSFAQYVGPQHFFDKDGVLTTSWAGFVEEKDETHNVKYYLNKQVSPKGYAWISIADIPKNLDAVPQHKIYLSKAYNGGDSFPHQIIGKAFYGEPNSVCSQTYLVLGYNANFSKEMCENIISYMSTRFFRYMVFIKKKTQDNPSSVFEFVPLQNFSKPCSDIDLYVKYGLTDEEIKFIEATVKPME